MLGKVFLCDGRLFTCVEGGKDETNSFLSILCYALLSTTAFSQPGDSVRLLTARQGGSMGIPGLVLISVSGSAPI